MQRSASHVAKGALREAHARRVPNLDVGADGRVHSLAHVGWCDEVHACLVVDEAGISVRCEPRGVLERNPRDRDAGRAIDPQQRLGDGEHHVALRWNPIGGSGIQELVVIAIKIEGVRCRRRRPKRPKREDARLDSRVRKARLGHGDIDQAGGGCRHRFDGAARLTIRVLTRRAMWGVLLASA
eukprot:2880612-Prymnesium_polylepis.1